MLMDNHCRLLASSWALPQPSAALPLDVQPVLSPSQCAHPVPLSTAPLGEGTGCQSSGVAELRQATSTAPLACQTILQPRMFSGGHHHLPMLATPDVLLVLHVPGNISQGYFPHHLSRCWAEAVLPVIPLVLLPVPSENRSGTGFPAVLCFPSRCAAVILGRFLFLRK